MANFVAWQVILSDIACQAISAFVAETKLLVYNVHCTVCNMLSTLAVHSALYPVSSFSVHFIHLRSPMSAICIVLCAICIVHCARSVERMQGSPEEQADRQKHCPSNPDLDAAKSFQLENKITSLGVSFPNPLIGNLSRKSGASGCKPNHSSWKISSQVWDRVW